MRMDIGSTARTASQEEIADKEPTSALDSAFAIRTIGTSSCLTRRQVVHLSRTEPRGFVGSVHLGGDSTGCLLEVCHGQVAPIFPAARGSLSAALLPENSALLTVEEGAGRDAGQLGQLPRRDPRLRWVGEPLEEKLDLSA